MNEEKKFAGDEQPEVRYDSSGKRIVTAARSKETEGAILAINEKLDQLIGILTSTLPARIGVELREASKGQGPAGTTANLDRLIEVVSKELPAKIADDADKNTFQKAEMLSMVISTSFQYLQDAIKAYQDSLTKTIEKIAELEEKTVQTLERNSQLLADMAGQGGLQKPKPSVWGSPPPSSPATQPSSPSSSTPPSPFTTPGSTSPSSPSSAVPPLGASPEPKEETRNDLPGWLQSKNDDSVWPPKPDSPQGS